ncbi:MAG: hypothetical protein RJA07_727 [Bacteroidota bacterium]|jgi:hypothetical protein
MNAIAICFIFALSFFHSTLNDFGGMKKVSTIDTNWQQCFIVSTASHHNADFCVDVINDENDDDDFFVQKRKVCSSVFENLSNSIFLHLSELSFSDKNFGNQSTGPKVLFHVLHSNFRI